MEVDRGVDASPIDCNAASREGYPMEQDKDRLQESLQSAETALSEATNAKNSAQTLLEEHKAEIAGVKVPSAVQNARTNELKDELSFARKVFNAAKAKFEVEKFRARKAGILVIQRVKASFIKEDDSPEVKAAKTEVETAKKTLAEILKTEFDRKKAHKEIVAAYKSDMETISDEKKKARKAISTLMEEVYRLDPASKPKETTSDGKRRGRKSALDGKTLSVHPDFANGNPHREGSALHSAFQAFLDSANQSIDFNNAVATGVPSKDITALHKSGKLVVKD